MARRFTTTGLAVAAAVLTVSVAVLAQAQQAPAGSGYKAPRTPWGDPDLQGIWPSTEMVGVPLQRPEGFGTRAFLTDAEFKARQTQSARQADDDEEALVAPRAGGG